MNFFPSPSTCKLVATLAFAFSCGTSFARTPVTCSSPASVRPQPTEYFVSLADYANHNAHVSIRFTQADRTLTLNMPVWNALYQVRDFAINIEDVRAQGATTQPLVVSQTKTSEWQVVPADACTVVDYDIHLDAGGPFGTQLNQEHGFFNWAMTLMYSPATRSKPVSVQFLDVPSNWALQDVHVMGEAPAGKVEQTVGVAGSYDELVDSPVELGVFQHYDFQQDGATYHIVVHASPSDYDAAKLEELLKKITKTQVEWMANRPFDSYTFLYHFPHGRGAGGMEHAFGTAIDLRAERLSSNMMPVASVSSHEFFHLWNVKRIRPQAFEPINYQSKATTGSLWFCEGLTSTVGDLMLARAGLYSERQYIDRIASEINDLQVRPARRWQSLEDSGVQAWYEGNAFYRTPGRSINYYNKGEIVGVLLDLHIRQVTNGRKSLRDLFRWMNDNYAKKGLYFPDSNGVQQAAETVTGQSFADFFRNNVAGTAELAYNDYFSFVGLQVAETTVRYITPGFSTTNNFGGQPEVTKVEAGTEAERAGIGVGDRILQINGHPADSSFDYEVSQMREGSSVKLRISSRTAERTVKLKIVSHDEHGFVLQDLPQLTSEQRAHRIAWVHGDDEDGGTR